MVLFRGSMVKGQGRSVSKFILHTRTLYMGLLELLFCAITGWKLITEVKRK